MKMSQVKIKFDARGRKNGRVCEVREFCGSTFDTVVIESDRWFRCNVHEQETLLLGVARQRYPEAEWNEASVIEYKQV